MVVFVAIARVVSVVIFVSISPTVAGELMTSLVGVSAASLVGVSTATSVANWVGTSTFFRCPSTLASWWAVALLHIAVVLFDLDLISTAMEFRR